MFKTTLGYNYYIHAIYQLNSINTRTNVVVGFRSDEVMHDYRVCKFHKHIDYYLQHSQFLVTQNTFSLTRNCTFVIQVADETLEVNCFRLKEFDQNEPYKIILLQ